MSSTLNSVDYFVIFIFAISMLAGFMRGLLKEIISLLSWIAAAVISSMFSAKLATAFGGASSAGMSATGAMQGASTGGYTNLVALGISFVVLFIGTLFVGYIVNIIVTGIVQGAFISLPNRLLGVLFGAIRGFIIVIVLMFIAELTPMGAEPAWAQSQFVKAFAPCVAWLQNWVQPGLELIRNKTQGAVQSIQQNMPSTQGIQNMLGGATGGSSSGGQ